MYGVQIDIQILHLTFEGLPDYYYVIILVVEGTCINTINGAASSIVIICTRTLLLPDTVFLPNE